jgi:flagellar basal body-associated protein FliL
MTKKTKKTILLGILIAIAAGTGFGYYMWNKPHRSVESADGIQVVAAELLNQYVQDSAAANKKYTDKVVEVTGEVTDTSTNQQNERIIKLKTTQEGAFVNCTFEQKSVTANPGIKITVKGICGGYSGGDADMGLPGDVVIVRCYLIQ